MGNVIVIWPQRKTLDDGRSCRRPRTPGDQDASPRGRHRTSDHTAALRWVSGLDAARRRPIGDDVHHSSPGIAGSPTPRRPGRQRYQAVSSLHCQEIKRIRQNHHALGSVRAEAQLALMKLRTSPGALNNEWGASTPVAASLVIWMILSAPLYPDQLRPLRLTTHPSYSLIPSFHYF